VAVATIADVATMRTTTIASTCAPVPGRRIRRRNHRRPCGIDPGEIDPGEHGRTGATDGCVDVSPTGSDEMLATLTLNSATAVTARAGSCFWRAQVRPGSCNRRDPLPK
jgi:hypothetical protein